jgi:ubiquinone/menaquinone biosynthesis C-methylase UbiE
LKPGLDLLDVGCGPGTITLDLAERVAPGSVIGLDRDPGVLEVAERSLAERERTGRPAGDVTFRTGDVYALEFPDGSFDVVHAHQVLQHLTDPVAALREMRRVIRPGGLLAVRDSDYGAKFWAPAEPMLDRWMALYHEVTRANGAEADAGRHLPGWVRTAGFAEIKVSSSTWTFADPETTRWWGELWADRTQMSSFAEQALSYGLSNSAELASISAAWRKWSTTPGAFIVIIGVEVLARP